MKNKKTQIEYIVVSLGGSLLVHNTLDTAFIKRFKQIILKEASAFRKFILVVGGGKVCRDYQAALKAVSSAKAEDLDWLGIFVTQLNAWFLQLTLGKSAFPHVAQNPLEHITFRQPILVAGGYKPGRSSDFDAVALAATFGASTIINLTNIDYVYTKDPKKFKRASALKTISWKEYRRMIGSRWQPGAHTPFDPVASEFAQKHNQTVVIMSGKKLQRFQDFLHGGKVVGTIISD